MGSPSHFVVSDHRPQYVQVPQQLVEDQSLDIWSKAAYMALDSFRNGKTGLCFPSHTILARRAGMSTGQLKESIKSLENKGWLSTTRTSGKSNHYHLIWKDTQPQHGYPQPQHGWVPSHSMATNQRFLNQKKEPKGTLRVHPETIRQQKWAEHVRPVKQ